MAQPITTTNPNSHDEIKGKSNCLVDCKFLFYDIYLSI